MRLQNSALASPQEREIPLIPEQEQALVMFVVYMALNFSVGKVIPATGRTLFL